MRQDIRDFFNIDASVTGFRNERAKFGAFPLPTENTILAAELLCRALNEKGVPASLGAVCIVELRAPGTIKFIITASGGGSVPAEPVRQMRAHFQDEIGSTLTVQCLTVDTTAVFYTPAHTDTVSFVQRAFMPFNAAPGMVELNQAIQAIQHFPNGNFGFDTSGRVLNGNLTTSTTPIHRVLACAVAMRNGMFHQPTPGTARRTLQSFVRWLDRNPYGDRAALGDNLEALAIPGGNPQQYMYRENPNRPIPGHNIFQSLVNQAWTVADLSRFCAEPKAFNFIKIRNITGGLAGQLSLWWDTRPNRYSTHNLEQSPYVSYMLPCSSCRTRAVTMLAGISAYAPGVQELPTRGAPSTEVRPRRGSFP